MADETEHNFAKGRIEALTDGIFATVMTILVLSLVVPVVMGPNPSQQLASDIVSMLPNLFVYAGSFIVLLVMWIGHNNFFRYIHNVDRKLQWLNGLALLLIGLVPFSTAFLGRYPLQQPAIILYGVNFLLIGVMFNILRKYATHDSRRMHGDAGMEQYAPKSNIIMMVIYALSLVFSFVSPYASLALFFFMPIYYLGVAMMDPN